MSALVLVGMLGACVLGRGGLAGETTSSGGGPTATGGAAGSSTTSTTTSTTSTTSSGTGATGGAGGAGGQGGAEPWLTGYDRRKPIDFAPVDSPLPSFPAAVLLDSDPELAAASLVDGRDLRFTTEDAQTILPHELELFDQATGQLAAWVRIPELRAGASTRIYLYYGNAAALQPGPASDVWAGSFAGVWHLAQDPSSGPGAVRDSSGNANHGTAPLGLGTISLTSAMAGFGLDFDTGASPVDFGDPADGSLDFGSGSFSFSVWVLAGGNVGSWDMPWYKGGSNAGNPGYDMELGNAEWNAGLSGGNTYLSSAFGNSSGLTGSWQHLVAVVDRSTQELRTYTNGVRVDTEDITAVGSADSAQPAVVNPTGYPLRATLDELRVATVPLSATWIAAEHANLSTPTAFFHLGLEELAP